MESWMFCLLLVLLWSVSAQGPYLVTKMDNSGGNEAGVCSAVDSAGNLYFVGYFLSSQLDIYAQDGVTSILNDNSGSAATYIIKMKADMSSLIWVTRIDSSTNEWIQFCIIDDYDRITVSGHSGGSPVVMYDFQGRNNASFPVTGPSACFVAVYSPSGRVVWAGKVDGPTGSGSEFCNRFVYDSSGGFLLTGYTNSFSLTLTTSTGLSRALGLSFPNTPCYHGFVIRMTTTWGFDWALKIDGTKDEQIYGITLDTVGNIYVGIQYTSQTISFYNSTNPATVVTTLANYDSSEATSDVAVPKYSPRGELIQVIRIGGLTNEKVNFMKAGGDNVYVVGWAGSSPIVFHNAQGASSVSWSKGSTAYFASYLVKYSPDGNVQWAVLGYGDQGAGFRTIEVDSVDTSVFVGGYAYGISTTFYDPQRRSVWTIGNENVAGGTCDSYIIRYNSTDGRMLNFARMGGTSDDTIQHLLLDRRGSLIGTGIFKSTAMSFYGFDQQQSYASLTLPSSANDASFALKLNLSYAYPQRITTLASSTTSVSSTTTRTTTVSSSSSTTRTTSVSSSTTQTTVSPTYSTSVSTSSTSVSFTSTSLLQTSTSVVSSFTSSSTTLLSSLTSSSTTTVSSTTRVLSSTTAIQSLVIIDPSQNITPLQVPSNPSKSSSTSASEQSVVSEQQTIIIIAGVIAVLILIISFLCLCLYIQAKRTPKPTKSSHKTAQQRKSASSVTAVEKSRYSADVTKTFNSATTTIVSKYEISVPGWLQLDYGLAFLKGDTIAKGGAGTISYCLPLAEDLRRRSKGSQLVLKTVAVSPSQMSEKFQQSFYQELSIMYRFRDTPGFVRFFGFCTGPVSMILLYYPLGDLDNYIQGTGLAAQKFPYTKPVIIGLLTKFCKALYELHNVGIAHCDIKPANILLDFGTDRVSKQTVLEPIMTDFGISKIIDSSALKVQAFQVSELRGASYNYAAPEVFFSLKQKVYNTTALNYATIFMGGDIYAISMTILEMLNRKSPWQ